MSKIIYKWFSRTIIELGAPANYYRNMTPSLVWSINTSSTEDMTDIWYWCWLHGEDHLYWDLLTFMRNMSSLISQLSIKSMDGPFPIIVTYHIDSPPRRELFNLPECLTCKVNAF